MAKRPSYLEQIAPLAPRRRRAGLAVLLPPRPIFRSGHAMPDLVETETRAVSAAVKAASPTPPLAGAADSAQRTPREAPRTPAPTNESQKQQAAVTTPGRPVQPSWPRDSQSPQPQTKAAAQAKAGDNAARSVDRALADRETAPKRSATASRTTEQSPAAVEPVSAVAVPAARIVGSLPTSTTITSLPAARPEPSTASVKPERAVHRTPPPLLAVKPEAAAAPPSARPVGQPAPPAAQIAAEAALPLIAPPVPQPRAPIPPPMRERPASGLHIGTLEVRVVAPAAPPVPSPSARTTARTRVGRAAAGGGGRIARSFGVFGLGQT